MRLTSLNKNLSNIFEESSNIHKSELAFKSIFQECMLEFEKKNFNIIDNKNHYEDLINGREPEGIDLKSMVEEMDAKYFDAEDEGNFEQAGAYFALARLMSAISLSNKPRNSSDYAEAAYEVLMSLPNPQAASERIAAKLIKS
jgi:hypothetical protein